jgi:Glycosyltransferase family 87
LSKTLDTSAAVHLDPTLKARPWRIAAATCMLALGVCILAIAMSGSEAENRDYHVYWAVGQQLVHHHHGNPYDSAAMVQILRQAGSKSNTNMILRNPPSALFITLPLGFVSIRTGAIIWSLAVILSLMVSIRMLWTMQGRPQDRLHLIGYIFPPALACLLAGQLGTFILLGVTLFLYFHTSKPYFSGVALLLCALKPHLFLPFGVVLFAWIVLRKAYPILLGASVALIASVALSLVLDPAVWSHYARAERAENIQNLFIPCVSLVFRVAIHRKAIWLQILPALAGCVWGIWYFATRRDRWSWVDHGALLLLISVMVAPYAWFTDEVILLPAILAGLYRASNAGRSLLPFGCIAGVALLQVIAGVPLTSGFYVWTAPAWLAWYLYAVRGTSVDALEVPNHHAQAELLN